MHQEKDSHRDRGSISCDLGVNPMHTLRRFAVAISTEMRIPDRTHIQPSGHSLGRQELGIGLDLDPPSGIEQALDDNQRRGRIGVAKALTMSA